MVRGNRGIGMRRGFDSWTKHLLVLLFPSSVTLGKLLPISEHQFPVCKVGRIIGHTKEVL